jgi:hypothetical protein
LERENRDLRAKHYEQPWTVNEAEQLRQRATDAEAERDKLLTAIKSVHAEHADDLCWMPADVNRIFAAAGLPPQDLRVGDTEAMRRNCDRYIACLQSGGPWKSYAELEAERDKLREALVALDHWLLETAMSNDSACLYWSGQFRAKLKEIVAALKEPTDAQ